MHSLWIPFFALCIMTPFLQGAEESTSKSSTPSPTDKNWLQGYIQEQQQLQESRKTDSKENPFKALQKPASDSSQKETEPFRLLGNSEKPSSPTSEGDSPRAKTPLGDMTFKPAISGMNAEIYNQQRQETQSRSVVERMESANSNPNSLEIDNEETLEKMRRQRLQQNLKTSSDTDKLINENLALPSAIDHPNLDQDTKNPYLQQNRSLLEKERDRLNQDSPTSLNTLQMIKPIEAPHMIPSMNPQRSSFEISPFQNPKAPINPMLQLPGTQKRGVQDPNDFLRK